MNEQQWNSTVDLASLVHVVNIQSAKAFDVNIPRELREFSVEFRFLLLPIVPVFPAIDETLYVG